MMEAPAPEEEMTKEPMEGEAMDACMDGDDAYMMDECKEYVDPDDVSEDEDTKAIAEYISEASVHVYVMKVSKERKEYYEIFSDAGLRRGALPIIIQLVFWGGLGLIC